MRPQLMLGMVAAAVLLALPAAATGQASQRPAIRFQAQDTNGDGVITRQEWRGSNQSFLVHDWNGDGVLSGDEVRVGARRQRSTVPDYAGNDDFDDWTTRGFNSLDHDRDGRVSQAEWHFNRETFHRADHNRDGVLSRAEFLGEAVEDDRDDRFDYLDADGSGTVELDEWHATRQEFRRLDADSDGVLSRREVTGATAAEPAESFGSLDVNRNGTISFNEWHWSRASFDRRDANGDGVVSRSEFGSTDVGGAVGTTGQVVVVPARQRWTDSGLTARRGDAIVIDATGTITMSGDGRDQSDAATPAGSRTGRRAAESPLPDRPAGGLLVRVGEAPPLYLGSTSGTLRAPVNGRIYFGVNDDHLDDNSGEFRVRVSVQRGN
jgi:Ca2+-binding EF-hand superfamily protein